jgi:hypothetical protein
VIAEDVNLDLESREAALRTFVTQNAQDIISLLYELQDWRNQSATGEGNHLLDKHARIIVEGFSDDNAADALSDALNKTSHYFFRTIGCQYYPSTINRIKKWWPPRSAGTPHHPRSI